MARLAGRQDLEELNTLDARRNAAQAADSAPSTGSVSAKPPGVWQGTEIYLVVMVACAILVGAGLWLALTDASANRQLIGVGLMTAGAMGALCVAVVSALHVQLRAARVEAARSEAMLLSTVADRLSEVTVMMNVISEQQLISDRAKSIAYREKDRETLRRAIREETARGDWEAARVLVDEMEAQFGNRLEAERARAEIYEQRDSASRRAMTAAQERIERLCRNEDWQGAQAEASRFIADHPDFAAARELPAQVEERRQAYKRKLIERFNECVVRHDSDGGMEVLRLLDPYLTPAEGERLAESARSIFNDRKAALRNQITSAVQSQKWQEALRAGEMLLSEFPNTKAAQEVREMMDTLRARAAETQTQPVG